MLSKRIIKETETILKDSPPGIKALPNTQNNRHFEVVIDGPQHSPYQGMPFHIFTVCSGGKFQLELFLPEDYPMSPPKVRFLTKIYHPNIDNLGRICLDVLKGVFI